MAAEPLPHDPSDPSHAGGDGEPALWSSRPGGARRADRQGRVVQSMARKVTRPCRRSGCPAPAQASMVLDYAGKRVTLVSLLDEADPRFLEVCPPHAAGMDVPRGWDLVDEREDVDAPTGPPTAREMGSSATVAVLAEALRRPSPDIPESRSERDDEPEPTPVHDQPLYAAGSHEATALHHESTSHDDVAAHDEVPANDAAASHDDGQHQPAAGAVAPTPPSGRISQPRPADDLHDRRQLRLDGQSGRGPRPVPASLED